MEALRVEDLTKDFGGVRAMQHVSFSVKTGEHLAIIGPNGAVHSAASRPPAARNNRPATQGQCSEAVWMCLL